MNSIQTKETPPALAALSKVKANRGITMSVQQPAAVIVENSPTTETTATQPQAPEDNEPTVVQATPLELTPASTDGRGDYKEPYNHLRVAYEQRVNEVKAKDNRIQQLEQALSQATAPRVEFPKTKEELEEFRKTNPDAYDFMRSIALEAAAEQDSTLKERLEAINRAQAELREKEAFSELLAVHPDAKEIRASAEFAKWFNDQPEAIQSTLANSKDVKAIIKLLTLYKVETSGYNPKAAKKAKAQEQVDASLAVNIPARTEITPPKKIYTRSEINAISSNYNTWLQHKDEIDLARREGRVDETK